MKAPMHAHRCLSLAGLGMLVPLLAGCAGEPLLATPTSVPRTLSPEHWRRLDDGRLLARQPRVDWATLLRRTWATTTGLRSARAVRLNAKEVSAGTGSLTTVGCASPSLYHPIPHPSRFPQPDLSFLARDSIDGPSPASQPSTFSSSLATMPNTLHICSPLYYRHTEL